MSKENNLSNTNKKALNETTNILKDLLKNNLIKVVLYGSYARGDYNDFSDIDVFILVNKKKGWYYMASISINLTNLRLKQAQEDLDDANYLFGNGSYKGANNRAYYSIFHTMKAVLSLEPIDFKRHKDVIAYFNQNYINEEVFPKELGHKIKK